MSRVRRVTDFELTLAKTIFDKRYVFFALEEHCDQIVVARERHGDGTDHLHCYVRTNIFSLVRT